ncbi:hypothetical protein [Sphingobium yanoikuyae]|uniref:hypothetical protein n=1 Tax=Sphingobium yanoikuyae TaxID=13690 RepID=UPI00243320F7|nr:hypothetical protein [Sphingobium yanoikuyae]
MLTAINVPENDYPVWSAAATYALGARVILTSTHRIYESAGNSNVGNEPTGISGQWIDIAPTNRWAMFDQALGSQTERAGSIVVSLDPVEAIDAIALLDVIAASVRVQGAGYDRTLAPAAQPGAVTFLDLPLSPGPLTVTISGSGTVSVGTLLIGKLLGLGTTESSPTAAITDYSRKETGDFGDVSVVERAWAKRMDVRALISTTAVDIVAARLADVRATPALWIGHDTLESLTIYGFFKDFSIAVDENVSTLSLSIEGLSAAAKTAPIVAPTVVQVIVFRNGAIRPAPPAEGSGVLPPGWTVAPIDLPAGQYRWWSQADFEDDQQRSAWTTPVRVDGSDWTDIIDDDPTRPKPDDGATVGGTIGIDIRIPEIPGIPAPPGLIRNDMLELRRDGGLWYRPYGSEAAAMFLGKIALPDIGAASAAAQRQLDDALNRLSNAIGQALAGWSQTRETLRDAGIYVDPTTGTVRIAAIDQTAERVSEAYIRLDALRGEIVQRATVSYVDGKIAQLVLDPSQFPIYEGIELRVYNAEQRISGAEASIAQKASALDLNAQGARLTTAEVIIEALEGQITQKVDSVEFNALGERVTSAETVLSALGDTAGLTQAVVVARRFPSDIAKAQENALLALLEGDKANRGAIDALASARQELTAGITDARTAFAAARQELIVRIGAAEAAALNQTRLQIEGDQALATQITNLTVSIGDQLAGFDQRIFALVLKDDLITAGLAQTISAVRGLGQDAAKAAENALMTLLTGDRTKREQIGAIAAAREELTVKVNGDIEAVVQRISAILARMGVAEASIVAEQFARVTANLAIAAQLVQLGASIGNVDARVALEETVRAALGEALAASIQTLAVEMQDGDAALAAQAVLDRQASIDGDGILASSIDELRAEKNDGEADIIAQANLDRQARIDNDLVIAASVDELRAIRDDDITTLLAQASEDRQARIDGDDIVAASVDELRAMRDDDVATLLALNSEERQARIDADGALSARQDTLSATVDGVTAELTEQAAVLVDLEGRTAISFRIAATDPDGTTYIEIQRQSGTGRILLGGDVITPGSITAQEIEANGITRAFTASNNASIGLTNDMADTATFSVAMARRGSIIINSVQQLVFATGGAWETELTVSDNLLMSGSSNSDHQSVLLGEFYADTPGNYIVHLRARRTAGAVSINAGGARMTILRTYA